jgi:hypothetical protein
MGHETASAGDAQGCLRYLPERADLRSLPCDKVFGVFWIFNFVVGTRDYFLICQKCGETCEGAEELIEKEIPVQQQIAPMDRFGCLIFIGLFIALVWIMTIVKQ